MKEFKELIKIKNGKVSARELHEFLEVGKRFTTWIKGRIDKYEFKENVDYEIIKFDLPILGNQNKRGGDRRSVDYIITLDMAKNLIKILRSLKLARVKLQI